MHPLIWILISTTCALAYGLHAVHGPERVGRSLVKTGAVGALALLSVTQGLPWLLSCALIFGTLGDAALSRRGTAAFLLGLGAFLIGHLAYIPFFLDLGSGVSLLLQEPWRAAVLGGILVASVAIYLRIRPYLGPLRRPVLIYCGVILVMCGGALTLPAIWPAILGLIGAMMFTASDAILGLQLFLPRKDPAAPAYWSSILLWFLYWGGQLCILLSVLLAM